MDKTLVSEGVDDLISCSISAGQHSHTHTHTHTTHTHTHCTRAKQLSWPWISQQWGPSGGVSVSQVSTVMVVEAFVRDTVLPKCANCTETLPRNVNTPVSCDDANCTPPPPHLHSSLHLPPPLCSFIFVSLTFSLCDLLQFKCNESLCFLHISFLLKCAMYLWAANTYNTHTHTFV